MGSRFGGGLITLLLAACGSSAPPPDPTAPLSAPRPFLPPPKPVRDVPYLQELNHPLLDGHPDRVPLIGVVHLPASFQGWAQPLLVLPRGLRDGDHPPAVPNPVADGDEALSLALASSESLFLASPRRLIRVTAAGVISSTTSAEPIRRLFLAPGGVYVVRGSSSLAFAKDEGALALEPLPIGGDATLVMNGALWVATSSAIRSYALSGALPSAQLDEVTVAGAVGSPVALVPLSEERGILPGVSVVLVGARGLMGFDAGLSPLDVELFHRGRVPYDDATDAAQTGDGSLVVATSHGAMRLIDRGIGTEWRVYNATRWIPSPSIRAVATLGDQLWFATDQGLGHVTATMMTLEEKLGPFVDRIVERHDRDGAVADSHLLRRGDLSSNVPWDSDNDGSWTGYWVRGECYRFKVTSDSGAKVNFDEALEGMLRLRDQSGMPHFVARSAIRKSTCMLDDCDAPDDGQWFTSPDGEWWIKADTSNDEVIAHLAMMGVAYDVCADAKQKERIKDHIVGIIGGIVDHGWTLVDRDGLPTTYGRFDPAYVNDSIPGSIGDGGVLSAEILAGLTLAHYFTKDPKFYQAKRQLIDDYHYAENAERELEYPFRRFEMDNDEMAVNAWLVLLQYEPDPELYQRWVAAAQRNWAHKFSLQQAPWWSLIHGGLAAADAPPEDVVRWLRLAPVDMIRWSQTNSDRLDLIKPNADYFKQAGGLRSDGRILPYDERRCDRWNTDQYQLDGGFDGMVEMDGADVLEPYWLARYAGWILPN